MKYAIGIEKLLMITVLIVGLLWSLCGAVHAAWHVTQGTAGQVQDPGVLTRQDLYYGWGMEVVIEAFSTAWVHFPIQLQYLTNIRRIGIDVRLENTTSYIHQIHVWAGGGKKHEFTNPGWQGDWGERTTIESLTWAK